MKNVSSYFMAAALFAAITLAGGTAANAALLARSPSLTAPGGFPAWYQDQNGLALQPCLDQTTPGNPCGLLSEPGFNAAQPIVFPTNFPAEVFYYLAISDDFLVGAAQANVELAIEGGFLNPVNGDIVSPAFPGAVPNVFNRMRVNIDPAVIGTYTVTHPFGQETFPCDRSQCSFTIDLPIFNPFNFDGALGIGIPNTMSVFLKQTAPAPATGFIGDSASPGAITGGPLRNTFGVTGPSGTGSTANFTVTGKTIGLTVEPQAGADFGAWNLNAPSTPITFTVTNLTGVAIPARDLAAVPPAGLILTPSIAAFTIPAATDTCAAGIPAVATATIPNTCTFEVVFTPTDNVVSSGTISIASAASPTVTIPVTGAGDSIAPTLVLDPVITFTKLLTQTISGTVFDINGVASVQVSVNGVSQGTAAILPGNPPHWTKDITLSNAILAGTANSISVTATDTAQPGGNISIPSVLAGTITTITTDTIIPAVSVTAPVTGNLINTRTPVLTFTADDINFSFATVTVDGVGVNPTPANNTALASLPDGPHTVRVDAGDSAGNAGTATTTFTVDATPPVITVDSPKPINQRIGAINPLLTFSINDANPDATKTVVTLDGIVVAAPVSGTTTLGPFTAGSEHTLTVAAADILGNVSSSTTGIFTIVLSDGSIITLGATPPSIADALITLRHAVGLTPLLVGDQFAHADVAPLDANGVPNPDNSVDIADALLILRKVVGLVTTF